MCGERGERFQAPFPTPCTAVRFAIHPRPMSRCRSERGGGAERRDAVPLRDASARPVGIARVALVNHGHRLQARRCRTPGRRSGRRGPHRARTAPRSDRTPRSRLRASGSRGRSPRGCKARRHSRPSGSRPSTGKRRRRRAQVEADVEERAARAADEFGLGVRLGLKVHAAERPAEFVERDGALHDGRVQSVRGEGGSVPRPRKVPARVGVALGPDEDAAGNSCRLEAHGPKTPRRAESGRRTGRPRRGCRPSARRSRLGGSTAG